MKPCDTGAFFGVLDQAFAILGHGNEAKSKLSGEAKALWFKILQPWPLETVVDAIAAHMRRPITGRTLPIPADIVAQIEGAQANDGRPGVDAAWAMALRANDEADTVVWTAEIDKAWVLAREVLQTGDEVGARMAFKDEYARLVDDARAAGRAPYWKPSLGHDPERRAIALERATRQGITIQGLPDDVVAALPAPTDMSLDRLMLGTPQRSAPIATKDTPGAPSAAHRANLRAVFASLAAYAASKNAGVRTAGGSNGGAFSDAAQLALKAMDDERHNAAAIASTAGPNGAFAFVDPDLIVEAASNGPGAASRRTA